MKELQRVNSVQAKRLKKLGFDWECDYHFYKENCWKVNPKLSNKHLAENSFSAPTVAHALMWFRVEHNLIGKPYPMDGGSGFNYMYYKLNRGVWCARLCLHVKRFNTYEAAESAVLDELLTILEKEEKR
jgi:hypothetical protein